MWATNILECELEEKRKAKERRPNNRRANERRPTLCENKFLTNFPSVAFDEIFRWPKISCYTVIWCAFWLLPGQHFHETGHFSPAKRPAWWSNEFSFFYSFRWLLPSQYFLDNWTLLSLSLLGDYINQSSSSQIHPKCSLPGQDSPNRDVKWGKIHQKCEVSQDLRLQQNTSILIKGSVEWSRHERHFCSLLPYFLLSWLQIFQLCLSFWTSSFDMVLFKKSFRKKKNIQKTSQNALAPSIFIVLSIVLKLGTPLLHIQAQNSLLQNFWFRSRSRDMDEKLPKTLFYPTRSALTKLNFSRRSKLKNL